MFGIYKKSHINRNSLYVIFFGYPKLIIINTNNTLDNNLINNDML